MNSPSTLRAIYAFSGDPITFGHIDIVKRAARTYPHVLVAIGINPSKANRYTFDDEERLAMAELCFEDLPNVECKIFQGLLGEYAYRHGYDVIIRGIRNNSDLESELVLYKVNETLHPELDTVFFPTKPELSHISSSVVKALIRESGDVSKYCHLGVKEALERRLLKKSLIGLSGGIACGKTYLAKKLINLLNEEIQATYISLDEIGHYVLSDHSHRLYRRTRDLIVKTFGDEVANLDGTINRKALGAIVFNDSLALSQLNVIMREPMLTRLYQVLFKAPDGVLLIEGAILIENGWGSLVNNNVILVEAEQETRIERLMARNNCSREEAESKIARQVSPAERALILSDEQVLASWGKTWVVNNDSTVQRLDELKDQILDFANQDLLTTIQKRSQ